MDKYSYNSEVVGEKINDNVIIIDPNSYEAFVLENTAAYIWTLFQCNKVLSLRDLHSEITKEFGELTIQDEEEIHAFITELEERNILIRN